MAAGGEFSAQFSVVVDFPIEDCLDRASSLQRLLATGQIDFAEAAHADAASALEVISVLIRPSMPDFVAQRADLSELDVPLAQKLSGNATHGRKVRSFAGLSQIR